MSVPISNNWAGGAARGRRAAWSVAPDDQGRARGLEAEPFPSGRPSDGQVQQPLDPEPSGQLTLERRLDQRRIKEGERKGLADRSFRALLAPCDRFNRDDWIGDELIEPMPSYVTNICFGGPDLRTAYVTCGSQGRIYAFDWPIPGLRLNFDTP